MFNRKTDGKIEALQRVPAFAALSRDDLDRLASLADLVEVPDNTVLMREGARGTEVYLVVEGEVRVSHGGVDIASLGAGDFVGEMALLDDQPRSATVTTDGSTRVLVFDPRAFDRMVQTNRGLTKRLLRQISARLREADSASQLTTS